MKKILALILLIACFIPNASAKKSSKAPISVIFDTDMGNDVDDVLALDMLYKYTDAGKIKLIGTMASKTAPEAALFIDMMNKWYGYDNLPIGVVRNGGEGAGPDNFARTVIEMKKDGKPMFERNLQESTASLPDAEVLYRKLLSQADDKSVVIISVGFSTNLARLLATTGDSYSPLSGKQLIAKKVKYISVMAGCFDGRGHAEYNVTNDIPACQKLFNECPVPIVVSPFEVGEAVKYPYTSIKNDFNWVPNHPLVEAYTHYLIPMPHDRPMWDPTAVLEVLEPGKFMTRTNAGTITIDDKGFSTFKEEKNGKHCYLKLKKNKVDKMVDFFVKVITTKPKNK